jgi:hypothetical protein
VQLPAYATWSGMISRCYSPKNQSYENYGGKGVTVHPDWHHYQDFATWYHENHVEGWSIDKDALGGKVYGPDTCIYIPEQVSQVLKSFDNPKSGMGKSTHTWYVKTTDIDGNQHYKGKFRTECEAMEYHNNFLREKIKALIIKYSIPAATAEKLTQL